MEATSINQRCVSDVHPPNVVVRDLSNNNLGGTIPSDLAMSNKLNVLYVPRLPPRHHATRSLTQAILRLRRSLSHNQFTSLGENLLENQLGLVALCVLGVPFAHS